MSSPYLCGNPSCTFCRPQASRSLYMDRVQEEVRREMRLLLTTFPEALPALRAAIVDGRIVGGAWGGMSPSGFVGCIIGWIEHVYSGGNRQMSLRASYEALRASYEARMMGRAIIEFVDRPIPIRKGSTPVNEPRLRFLLDIITELDAEQQARAWREREAQEYRSRVFPQTDILPVEEDTSTRIPPWMLSVLATLPEPTQDSPPVETRELCLV